MKAIILAAGKGTRMKGLCDAQPKPMLPLLNRPMLDHILGGVREAGITEVLLVVGTHSEAIERHFGDGAALGLSIRYAHQRVPTGTGSAALLGKDFTADSPFLLAFGDIIISRREYARLARYYVERGCDTVLTTRWVPDPFRGAAVYVEGDKVVQIIEKPTPGTSTTHFDNAGVFVFPPDVFAELARLKPSPRGEYELTDAIHAFLVARRDVRAFQLDGVWHNLTGPEDLLAVNASILAESAIPHPPAARSPEHRPPNTEHPVSLRLVAPTARLDRAHLGPNTFIGEGCAIADGADLDNCILFPNAAVGRGARVSYAILADAARLAENAQVCGTAQDVKVISRAGAGHTDAARQ